MYFKLISALILITLCGIMVIAQNSDEEKRRIEFVKNLEKKKNKSSGILDKPILANDNKVKEVNNSSDEDVIKVETRLVRMDILVIDEKGNAVLGLKADDFIITENKIAQEVGTFSLGSSEEVPRTIVLIMDHSGSQIPYLKTSVAAAKMLVDKLNPKDTMAIVTDDIELLTDFTRDKELLKKSLDKLGGKSGTGKSLQLSALYVTIKEMFDSEDIRPIIIFQTDGDQLFSVRTETGPIDLQSPRLTGFTDKEMIETIEKSRTTIYSVIPGFSLLGLTPEEQVPKAAPYLVKQFPKIFQNHPEELPRFTQIIFRQQNAMDNIAKRSGGFSESLETPEQADKVYENILKGITNRYLIGYYPINQERDGKRRTVKIEVRGHPEYAVLGRKFYFAPQDKNTENK